MENVFMGYLIHIYTTEVTDKPINEPIGVIKSTDSYKCDNDVTIEFINERLEHTKCEDDTVLLEETIQRYQTWVREYKHRRTPKKSQAIKEIKSALGHMTNDENVVGYRFKY